MNPTPHKPPPAVSSAADPDQSFSKRLFEGSPDCIEVLDLDGRLLSTNAGWMRVLETRAPALFIGSSWIDFWLDTDREAAQAAVRAARDGGIGRFVGSFPPTLAGKPMWFDVVVSPILDTDGKPERLLAASRDVTESKRAERALRAIAEQTAGVTGSDFFHSLARTAAQTMGARYAFVAETLSELESRSLAFWEGTAFGAGFTYKFPGTPCQRVAAGHVCITSSGLREKFPEDFWLQQIGAESYVGVPMRNSAGRTIGHIAVLHTEPMDPSDDDVAALKIFASRACAELERKLADEKFNQANADLRRLNLEMSALLNVNRTIGHHLQRNVLFGSLAESLSTVVPTDRFGIELPVEDGKLHGYVLTKRMAMSENLEPTVSPAEGTAGNWVAQNRDWYLVSSRDELRHRFPLTFQAMEQAKMQSLCVLPLLAGQRVRGVLFFMAGAGNAYVHLQRSFMEQVAGAVAVALDDCLVHEEMRRLNDELTARKIAALEDEKQRISDQLKVAGEALTASEDRFRDLFDEAPIAYVHEGLDSKFIRANRAAMKILGIKPEDVPHTYGKTFAPDTPDAQRRLREAFESIERGTDTSGVVLELRRKDNGKPIWIQWWSRPDPSGTYTRTMFVDITERVQMEQEKARLEAQNIYLREEIHSEHNFGEIVGNSPALLDLLRQVEQVAKIDSTVLVLGETGTGKELIARAIHDRSPRKSRALVKVNCGAISVGLVESELFGHVKGAFTGAIAHRDGRFKLADGGTIFLDEVGELPLDTQVKLLRVLQEHEFEPIGSSRTMSVNVRVVAATNRDLEEMVREGKFRADLFYRLSVVPLRVPALRERLIDLPILVAFFVQRYAKNLGKQITSVSDEAMLRLTNYSWPGNVRELQNVIERAVILSPGNTLELAEELRATPAVPAHKAAAKSRPVEVATGRTSSGSLDDVERLHIESVLNQVHWMIEGERGAARILEMNPSTLRSRMLKLGISRPPKPSA